MIILKSVQEIGRIRESSQMVSNVLSELMKLIEPGITTMELDRIAESSLVHMGGTPAFKGYKGYPKTLCTSINEQVVHGIPSKRKLKNGDILSLDLGVLYNGYYGDKAVTVCVGKMSVETRKLLDVTEQALYKGIEQAREDNHLFDISHAIQAHVEGNSFSVVRDYVGHGIGTSLHEDPRVPNFGHPGKGPKLKKGLVIAIEPMVNAGGSAVEVLSDRWTVVTSDRKPSAHFEHTIAITSNGAEILSS